MRSLCAGGSLGNDVLARVSDVADDDHFVARALEGAHYLIGEPYGFRVCVEPAFNTYNGCDARRHVVIQAMNGKRLLAAEIVSMDCRKGFAI